MRKSLSLYACAAVMFAMQAAPAAAQAYSAGKIIRSIDDATLTATLDDLKATWEASSDKSDADTTIYEVSFETGLLAFAYTRACDPDCKGLVVAAAFDKPEGVTDADLAAKLRTFNDTHAAGKAFLGEDGSPMIQWYVIVDGGISMANLRTQLSVFTDIGYEFSDALYN